MDNRPIRPFRAVRFDGSPRDLAERTYVPPLSWAQAPERLPEHHVLRLLEPAFRDDDPGAAAQTARAWSGDGVLATDAEPAVYAYRTTDDGGVAHGVVVLVDLEAGLLAPHEDVIASYAIRQARLAEATRAQWEPITAFAPSSGVAALVAPVVAGPPARTVHDGGRTDELWPVRDPDVAEAIMDHLADQRLVIADGHHRYAAWRTATAREGRWALTLVYDAAAVRLGPIHRVLTSMSLEQALAGLTVATVRLDDPDTVAAYLADDEARAVLTDGERFVGVEAPTCASTWVEDVFTPHHGLEQADVLYEPDLDAAVSLAEKTRGTALLLSTPSPATVLRAAETGRLLPHKSSSFRPKPRVGMVMRRWDD